MISSRWYFAAIYSALLSQAAASNPPNSLAPGYTPDGFNQVNNGGIICTIGIAPGPVEFRRSGTGKALIALQQDYTDMGAFYIESFDSSNSVFVVRDFYSGTTSMAFTSPSAGTISFDNVRVVNGTPLNALPFLNYTQAYNGITGVLTVSYTIDSTLGCMLPVSMTFRIHA
jgi:hypothetical protein